MTISKLTKKYVDDLPLSKDGQEYHWDKDFPSFGLRVGKTKKTYVVQRDVSGTTVRRSVGVHGTYVPDTARKKAREMLVAMSNGQDPLKEKRSKKVKGITLEGIFKKYKSEKEGYLAKGTLVGYQDFLDNHLSEWKAKPLTDITKDMIIAKHGNITKDGKSYAANHTFKFLQTLYRYAQIDNDELTNPVDILTRKKLWNPKTRRDTLIKEHQIHDWYKAVMNLNNQSLKDALRFLLFTGLRKSEAFTMKWEYVDFKDKTFRLPTTKNKKPLVLPLSEFLYDLLKARKEASGDSIWVFTGNGKDGHITVAKKAVKAVTEESGVEFMLHDLRRTFITIAETVAPSQYSLKRLLNHSMSSDVTAGYINTDIKRLREIMQQVTDKIIEHTKKQEDV